MFLFFIAGIRPRIVTKEQEGSCFACGEGGLRLERVDHWFTLFFIPLFRVSRGAWTYRCRACGADQDGLGGAFSAAGGARARRRTCSGCGRELEDDHSFCPYCGLPA